MFTINVCRDTGSQIYFELDVNNLYTPEGQILIMKDLQDAIEKITEEDLDYDKNNLS